MLKIKSIKFKNHPILKNLELNFCDANGKAVDTIIIAGENGTGKSSILNYLYSITSGSVVTEATISLEKNGTQYQLYYYTRNNSIWVRDDNKLDTFRENMHLVAFSQM
mgnify:CR=1 FL=1